LFVAPWAQSELASPASATDIKQRGARLNDDLLVLMEKLSAELH
jgi:hypothetical protein